MDKNKKEIYHKLYYDLLLNIFYEYVNDIIESNNISNKIKIKLKKYYKEIYENLSHKIDNLIWNKFENDFINWFNKYYKYYYNDINNFYEICHNKFASPFIHLIEEKMDSEIMEQLNEKLNLIIEKDLLETNKNQYKENNESNLTNDETNHNLNYENNSKNINDKNYEENIKKKKIKYPIPINKKLKINESEFNDRNKGIPKISLGINIGSLNTVYSIFGKNEEKYITNVLLSDVSKRVIPSQICYSNTHRLYGDTASALMRKFSDYSYSNLSRLIGFDIDCEYFINEFKNFLNYGKYNRKTKKFKYAQKKEVPSSTIIADFLSLINKFYFDKVKKKENYKYNFFF